MKYSQTHHARRTSSISPSTVALTGGFCSKRYTAVHNNIPGRSRVLSDLTLIMLLDVFFYITHASCGRASPRSSASATYSFLGSVGRENPPAEAL